MGNKGEQANFVPFTKEERMQQLNEIDKSIVNLLLQSGEALAALSKPTTQDEDGDTIVKDRQDVFKDHMEQFLKTLQTVNVGMKRQILGLEEANIISLANKETPTTREEGGGVQATNTKNVSLEPDGDGKIGGLDVGWINSRSNKVENDMEVDLFQEAGDILCSILKHNGAEPDTEFKSKGFDIK
ncbi:mediator complex protein-domain-containing protein [Xylariaceae sp. FL0016]|nr:mediator complex protein-domain-containing protein [Xylariaceae sp. FL0016]